MTRLIKDLTETLPKVIPDLVWEDGKSGYLSWNALGYTIDPAGYSVRTREYYQLNYFGCEIATSNAKSAKSFLKKKADKHHRDLFRKALGQ